jgi:hypothetical protein
MMIISSCVSKFLVCGSFVFALFFQQQQHHHIIIIIFPFVSFDQSLGARGEMQQRAWREERDPRITAGFLGPRAKKSKAIETMSYN